MKTLVSLLFVGVIILTFVQLTPPNPAPLVAPPASNQPPFPDFGYMVPGYSGPIPVFKLSQNYPQTMPKVPLPDFFKIDYKKNWKEYLLAVQRYCFEGNTNTDFRVENNNVRQWYHMPWQHYGPQGREGFHGLTQEAPIKAFQLAPTQTFDSSGAVAVGFYNATSAYTIGKVWQNHNKPNDSTNMNFANGSVLFKILFATLPESIAVQQVPWLTNGLWWDAYPAPNFKKPVREQTKVVLVQMDIMVRDVRSPNGWIFGNFQYNGKMNKANKWENLVPVGIMWGEDPTNNTNVSNPNPTKTIINPNLLETIINPDVNELPPTHLGWNSRLNGPVDNPQSSCYSCHATAEYPQISPASPLFDSTTLANNPIGSVGWMRWFQNNKCGQVFDKGAISTDFSLQMAAALQSFDDWKATQGGLFASSFKKKVLLTSNPKHKKHKMIHPILR